MSNRRHHEAAAATIQERQKLCRDRVENAIRICEETTIQEKQKLYRDLLENAIRICREEECLSLRATARMLDKMGYLPPSVFGSGYMTGRSGLWSAQAVKRICDDLNITKGRKS